MISENCYYDNCMVLNPPKLELISFGKTNGNKLFT